MVSTYFWIKDQSFGTAVNTAPLAEDGASQGSILSDTCWTSTARLLLLAVAVLLLVATVLVR